MRHGEGRGLGRRIYTREFLILFVAGFFNSFSNSIIFPISSLYAENIGTPIELIGIIVGISTVLSLLVKFPFGYIADRISIKGLLIFGSTVNLLSPILYTLSSSPFLLFLTSSFHGFGVAFGIAALTLVRNLSPDMKSGEMIGVYGASTYSALVVGTALSGFLVDTFGFDNAFYFSAVFSVIGLILVFYVKDVRVINERSDTFFKGYGKAFRDHNVLLASFGIILLTLTSGILFSYLPIFSKDLGFSATNIGLFFTIWAFLSVIARPTMGKLSDKRGRVVVIIPMMILAMVGLYKMSTMVTIEEFYITSILYGFGYASAFAVLTVLAVDTVEPKNRGSAVAIFQSAYDVGIIGGSMGLGLTLSLIDYRALLLLATFILLAGIFVFTYISLRIKKSKSDPKCSITNLRKKPKI